MPRTEIHTTDDGDHWLIRTTVRNTPALKLIANTRSIRTETSVAEWLIPATYESALQLKTSIPDARWTKAAAEERKKRATARKYRIQRMKDADKPFKWVMRNGSREELAPFQYTGAQWLGTGSGILADEMGLGKTVQLVAATDRDGWLSDQLKVLVLCPTSALGVWEDHIERWTSVTPFVYHGPQRRRVLDRFDQHKGAKALISSHGLIDKHSDRLNYGSTPKEGTPGTFNQQWDIAIIDEAHKIGVDPGGKRVRSVMSIVETCDLVWCSTGTPVNDAPRDMWVLMRYVEPRVFGNYSDFCDRYCIVKEGKWRTENLGLHPDLEAEYAKMIKPWMLRRLKKTHGTDIPEGLPPKIVELDLTGPQATMYRQVVDEGITKMQDVSDKTRMKFVNGVLTKNTLLQYVANGIPILGEDGMVDSLDTRNSNKLNYLLEVAEDRAGDPFIVYTYSAKEARMYAQGLQDKGYSASILIGQTSKAQRDATVKLFQRGEINVLVLTNAGGDSITLTAADLMILARPSWRVLDNQQVAGRIDRWGQTRVPMTQILSSRGTVDETRLARLRGKFTIQQEMTLDDKRLKAILTGKVG